MIPFVDLRPQHEPLAEALGDAFARVLSGSQFILGPEVDRLERDFAATVGCRHAVGASNGLDALHLALSALGVGAGDEVILPVNTFAATALSIMATGARPVFVDCGADHMIDVDRFAEALSPRTKGVVPVHLFGRPANMSTIVRIARAREIVVVEDAAQAHGARHAGGPCGSWGDAAAFSFYPTKNLGALGDAGLVSTNVAALADRVRRLANYGQVGKYRHLELGRNCRLDTLQAALLSVKLPYLGAWNEARRRLADAYCEGLAGVGDLVLPEQERDGDHQVWHLFVIETGDRDGLQDFLAARGIGTGIHYPVPLHRQAAFAELGYKPGDFPVAERLADRVLSLPLYPGLGTEAQNTVVDAVRAFFASA